MIQKEVPTGLEVQEFDKNNCGTDNLIESKKLLTLAEFCTYINVGKTKGREILTKTNNTFAVRIGNRLYANKTKVDEWIDSISGNRKVI